MKADSRRAFTSSAATPSEQRDGDAKRIRPHGCVGNVAGRHRLRLARPIGRGQPQPGGKRAFALDEHAARAVQNWK